MRWTVAHAGTRRMLPGWAMVMVVGVVLFGLLSLGEHYGFERLWLSGPVLLIAGIMILQGTCEALVLATEAFSDRLGFDPYIGGTIAQIVSTLPEFVVITLLVMVSPFTAFIAGIMTIYNNAMVFSIYSYFLPKQLKGSYVMPDPITKAGTEVSIAGAGFALVVGLMMVAMRAGGHQKTHFTWHDLLIIGLLMLVTYIWYLEVLVKYYGHAEEEHQRSPVPESNPSTSLTAIIGFSLLGVIGSYLGGKSVSSFADAALEKMHLTNVQTALIMTFFGGISEIFIAYKAHRRGEMGIALSNVFGGITQAMFLVFPFTLVVIGIFMKLGMVRANAIPINFTTTILMLLLFPVFFVLFELIEEDHTLNNLDATAMTGIYALVLYMLLLHS